MKRNPWQNGLIWLVAGYFGYMYLSTDNWRGWVSFIVGITLADALIQAVANKRATALTTPLMMVTDLVVAIVLMVAIEWLLKFV